MDPGFGFPYHRGFHAGKLQDQFVEFLAAGGNVERYAEPSEAFLVVILRLGRGGATGLCCGEMTIECSAETTSRDILHTWKTHISTLKGAENNRYGLKFAERTLLPSETMKAIIRSKKELFRSWKGISNDGVCILHVYDHQHELGHIIDSKCFCNSRRAKCSPDDIRRIPVKAESSQGWLFPPWPVTNKRFFKPFESKYIEPVRSESFGYGVGVVGQALRRIWRD